MIGGPTEPPTEPPVEPPAGPPAGPAPEVDPEGDPREAFREPVPREPLPPAVAGTTRLPRGLSSLRHRNFRLFWSGQLVSLIGTWMQQVGQAWLVLQLTGDPLALGIVAAAQFTPVLILGLFAGILADAMPKRRLLFWTQAAAALLALILGVLVQTDSVQVWHVYLLALALGVVNSLDMPARQAFVVEMVGRSDIANAVALNSAVFNGSRIIGPAIAGVTIASIGLAPLFFVNAASYMAVMVSLVLMRPSELITPARAVVERTWRSVLDHLTEGLRYVRGNPPIFLSISVLAVVATFALNFQVLIPLLARDVLGGQADTFGFLMAASGIGSLTAALSIAFGQRPTLRLLLAGAGAVGLALIALGVSRFVPLSMILMFVAGWGLIAMAATTNTIIQLAVPDVLRGRVMSVYTTVFAGSVPIGGLFAGTVAAAAGAPMALALGGAISLLAVVVAFFRLPGGGGVPNLRAIPRSQAPQR